MSNLPINIEGIYYSRFINILLSEEYRFPEDNMLDEEAEEDELQALLEFLNERELPVPFRLIPSVDPEQIRALEEKASESEYYPLRSLNQYWVLDGREYFGDLEELVSELSHQFEGVVMEAYLEEILTAPLENAVNEPLFPAQGYLQAAPIGIDAEWVWTERKVFGQGVKFIDLELNWDLNHLQFAHNPPILERHSGLYGGQEKHGTAVLGIVYAGVDDEGIVGVAPGTDLVWALSHYRRTPVNGQFKRFLVPDAIVAMLAEDEMSAGDILLLEVQLGSGRPIEIKNHHFDAIRLAAAHGVVVVEAAGNKGDRHLDFAEDSGAIMVAASAPDFPENSPPSHPRSSRSNYGPRVDCFAWGADVTTIGYDEEGGNRFRATSAASAIIAGAAILVQSAHIEHHNSPLTPQDMRSWLSDPDTGTDADSAEHIGIMPNLEAILTTHLP